MNPKFLIGSGLRTAFELMDATFPKLGFRFKRDFYAPDMGFALRVLQRNGFAPSHAIDAGAYTGEWALLCKAVFPAIQILMVEPAEERRDALEQLSAKHRELSYRRALLAARNQTLHFREQLTNSEVVVEPSADTRAIQATTLDDLIADAAFGQPQLLKIDTQGYDLEVLRGSSKTLAGVEVIITEMSLIPLHATAPSFRDFVDWLDDAGFRLLDICGAMRRPVDDALWQIDAVFVRKESPLGATAAGWAKRR